MINNNKIVVTGGSGRFAQSLKKIKSKYKFIYPSKNSLNIINLNSIKKFLKKRKTFICFASCRFIKTYGST